MVLLLIFAFIISISSAQESSPNPFDEMLGENTRLSVDSTSGTLKYNFSEKTKELLNIRARMNVHLDSDKLELRCDELDVDVRNKKIHAIGNPVKIDQGPISAECGEFSFDSATDRSILLESPIIINKDEQGRSTITQGKKIIIERRQDGDTLVMVEGDAILKSEEGSSKTPIPEGAVTPAQKMFGKEFEIITASNGELLYSFSGENTLSSIVARNDVYITSDQVDLKCDRLEYYSDRGKLTAMGKPVKIFQKSIVAECGRFEFYPEKGKSILLEDPLILSNDEKGGKMETRGDRIVILQSREDETTILVSGPAEIEAKRPAREPETEEKEETTTTRVDESSVDIIKNLDIVQD